MRESEILVWTVCFPSLLEYRGEQHAVHDLDMPKFFIYTMIAHKYLKRNLLYYNCLCAFLAICGIATAKGILAYAVEASMLVEFCLENTY